VNGFKTTGLLANLDYIPVSNLAMRIEIKSFSSRDAIFVKQNESTKNNTALTASVAVTF
jgi:hypothetical protein